MPRTHAIAAAALLVALGCSGAQAGDFAARATGSFAAVGDSAGARTTCPDAAPSAAMSDADAGGASRDSVAADGVHAGPTRNARHIGVDDAASDGHGIVGVDDDKAAAGTHKPHAAARWQSLLPGVMK